MAGVEQPATERSPGVTDLTQYNIDWYRPGPRWKIIGWFLANAFLLNTYLPLPVGVKIALLRLFGANIGRGVVIKPALNVKYPWLLTIGDYTWIGEQVWIDNLAQVTIGAHACLSQGTMLLTGNHNYRLPTFDLSVRPIILENGAWIGAKAIVCPGVTVGSHAVLAVGSVATQSLEPYGVYQGNPAVWTRKRTVG